MQDTFVLHNVRFEHYQPQYATGRAETRPRISWQFIGSLPGNGLQNRFEIECYDLTHSGLKLSNVYPVQSSSAVLNAWPFEEDLQSRQRIAVRVRAEIDSFWSPWSTPSAYEVGLLYRKDWTCERIVAAAYNRTENSPQPEQLLRKDFTTRQQVQIIDARLYVVVQGVYEAELNGQRVSEDFLAPGWTKYDRHIRYQTYNVTDQLSASNSHHCIAFRLAEGWFCGRLGFFGGQRNRWGDFPTLMAQLEIYYADGVNDVFATDSSWLSCLGPTRLAELYNGEKYDARLEKHDWSRPSKQPLPEDWQPVETLESLPAEIHIVAGWGEPVRRIEIVEPVALIRTPSNRIIIDFGQNLVGHVRLKLFQGVEGVKVSLWHAEVLEHGELGRRPLRICEALDEYTCSGRPDGETWAPRFTFHGFRYCQVDGWLHSEENLKAHVEAVVCHTDMQAAGSFDSSDPLVNQLYKNTVWSIKGNFFSIPTDCPQRDERLGWTGDIALFAPTATKLYDCFGMLKDWMVDVKYDQEERGGIPALVTPDVLNNVGFWGKVLPIAIWHDVIILVPWALYEDSGDEEILRMHYGNMVTWLTKIPRNEDGILWDSDTFQLGDWLDPTASPHEPMNGQSDPILVADAFLVRCLALVAKIGAILGDTEAARRYSDEATTARERFATQYITRSGRVVSDSQTVISLAICFDLFSTSEQVQAAGQRLATIARRNNFKIATGFAGTPFILDALVKTGNVQVAYSMLQARECPSWLYPITLGATTIWERWDSMLPDGSINSGEMTSFNHYSLGAVTSFLHQTLAGLQVVEPGWRKSRAAPTLGGGFTHASSTHQSPYGLVRCSWTLDGARLSVTVVVPPLTSMEVVVPSSQTERKVHVVGAGEWNFESTYHDGCDWPVRPIPVFPEE
ncbi:glycoside hydrolase family 78 protein [Macroventuria anomochaeta]|uniref:Glycoside hydrolase family 78 protein n=1 Tax=Macroventuria anomochaeta TaxID=301207 RepID=A0ACB6RH39_9PLEO|nr:glycoside hydrolase family 78 protein [Macroventuria anomochaeta]KAF2621079.1 glycoside hydrolase family 78 protein [Macroventuria anomochaeta]